MGPDSDQLGSASVMELPQPIREAIDIELAKVKLADLERAFASLSNAYRSGEKKAKHLIGNELERLLYLTTRLPATYAALCHVIEYFQRVAGRVVGGTLLDIGSGPGTFFLAACQTQLLFTHATFIEKDAAWRTWGQKLINAIQPTFPVNWRFEDIEKMADISPHDSVVMSYSLGELHPEQRLKMVEKCWKWASRYLFLIEPGTPAGFSRIREARAFLLEQGAHVVAPCPHSMACPMPTNDWCHFSARLPRTSLHRRVKGGDLGYEDEKFSYVIFSRDACSLPDARIVRRPQRNKGHVCLQLCHQGELEEKIFSKKQGDLYREACRKEWGDSLD